MSRAVLLISCLSVFILGCILYVPQTVSALENDDFQMFAFRKSLSRGLNTNYTLGKRVIGDKLVQQNSGGKQYAKAENVKIPITYPTDGKNGYQVTFVNIFVSQSSDLGTAYIESGGIGQKFIEVMVEAWDTSFLNWAYEIYAV